MDPFLLAYLLYCAAAVAAIVAVAVRSRRKPPARRHSMGCGPRLKFSDIAALEQRNRSRL